MLFWMETPSSALGLPYEFLFLLLIVAYLEAFVKLISFVFEIEISGKSSSDDSYITS